MAPLVSIIIPVYNVFPYLREALDSVINQTYQNIEIIIVDDGSTDGSGKICDEYRNDARVKVIHQTNHGLSGARNTGLDLMTGKYTAFLDPDDAFCPDMIEKLLNALLQNNADLATCGYDILETTGELTKSNRIDLVVLEKKAVLTPEEALNYLLEGRFSTPIWNKVFASEIWKKLRFPEGAVYEDLRILPYILEKSKRITVIPQVLMHQRKRKDSITHSGTIQNIQALIDAYRLLWEYYKNRQPTLSNERFLFLQGTILRSFIFHWARIRKQEVSKETLDLLKNEIDLLASQTDRLRPLKTQVLWWLFCHCPQLIIPFQVCICKLKNIYRRNRVIAA